MNLKNSCVAIVLSMILVPCLTLHANGLWPGLIAVNQIQQDATQNEGISVTAGDGHIIVDFTEAAESKDLALQFVDPLGDDLGEADQADMYVVSSNVDLEACIRGCNRIADPSEYLECLEYCHKTFSNGGSNGGKGIGSFVTFFTP